MAGTGIIQNIMLNITSAFDPKGFKKTMVYLKGLSKASAQSGIGMMQLHGAFKQTNTKIINGNKAIQKGSQGFLSLGDAAKNVRRTAMKPFRGEFLSLMFLGMGLAKTFGSLVTEVLKVAGVFDVWRATLISVLGPILFPLAQILIKIMTYFMGLDDSTKKSIGVFIIFMAVFGQILALIAPLILLIHTAGGFGVVFGTIGQIAAGVFGIIAGGLMIAWTLISGLIEVFKNWGKVAWKVGRGILIVLIAIAGIVAIILGAPVLLVAGIVAVAAAIVKLVSGFKPVKQFFQWLGRVVQGIAGAIGGIFSGKGASAGWSEGYGSGVKKFASGGIVTRPTAAIIGEAGPEAVIPLGRGHGMGINYSPTINVSLSSASSLDLDSLAREINSRLYDDLRRVGIR